jgi:hypothetical protein
MAPSIRDQARGLCERQSIRFLAVTFVGARYLRRYQRRFDPGLGRDEVRILFEEHDFVAIAQLNLKLAGLAPEAMDRRKPTS